MHTHSMIYEHPFFFTISCDDKSLIFRLSARCDARHVVSFFCFIRFDLSLDPYSPGSLFSVLSKYTSVLQYVKASKSEIFQSFLHDIAHDV